MQTNALFVIMCFVMLYIAWVVTGGPSRPIVRQGPYITPVTRSGDEQQGYRVSAPANPVDPRAYPRQIRGTSNATSVPNAY